jgi:hypothetical protein
VLAPLFAALLLPPPLFATLIIVFDNELIFTYDNRLLNKLLCRLSIC